LTGHIFDAAGKQIGYVKGGFAYDDKGTAVFKVDGVNLLDLKTGDVVCHLTPGGLANTPGNESAGNASHHFTKDGG
jgi:hypothetical protein